MKTTMTVAVLLAVLMVASTVVCADEKAASPTPSSSWTAEGPGPAQWASAIMVGSKNKGKEMGLVLRDSGRGFANAMAGLSNGLAAYNRPFSSPSRDVGSGFWLSVYTPLSWAKQRASGAAKMYKTLTVDDLTEDDRAAVIRMVVHADTPRMVVGSSQRSSVEHVVIQSTDGKTVFQPLSIEPIDETVSNAMGGSIGLSGASVTFALLDVIAVRALDKKGEFRIIVVGQDNNDEKSFTVKTKHFQSLP